MALLDFITRNDPVAGLEISDSYLRIVELKRVRTGEYPELPTDTKQKVKKPKKKYIYRTIVKSTAEEKLDDSVVVSGLINNEEKFKQHLLKLRKKARNISNFVIVSVPTALVYSRYFSFPSTISDEKIAETMKLTAELQLPSSPTHNYSDWEKFGVGNSVLVASAKRKSIDKINELLIKCGFNTVAVEYSALSVARTFNQELSKKIFGLIEFNKGDFVVSVVENCVPKFTRVFPFSKVEGAGWPDEFRKIVDFYESEFHQKIDFLFQVGNSVGDEKSVSPLGVSEILGTSKISDKQVSSIDGKWLVALGAAERGVMKRSEDKLLSLMSIRTEEAYETKKALAFASFISSLVIGLSILMVGIFVGLWFLTTSLQRSVSNQIKALSAIPVPVGGAELESRARLINGFIADQSTIIRSLPRWSLVIEQIKNLTPQGVNIKNVNLSDPNGILSLSGSASTRSELRIFKKSLEESGIFTAVDLPISSISLKENIPFSITMRMVDPSQIFYR